MSEVRLVFYRPSFSAGKPSTVEMVAPNIPIPLSTIFVVSKPRIHFYTTA
jgi:hypothetical protein